MFNINIYSYGTYIQKIEACRNVISHHASGVEGFVIQFLSLEASVNLQR